MPKPHVAKGTAIFVMAEWQPHMLHHMGAQCFVQLPNLTDYQLLPKSWLSNRSQVSAALQGSTASWTAADEPVEK